MKSITSYRLNNNNFILTFWFQLSDTLKKCFVAFHNLFACFGLDLYSETAVAPGFSRQPLPREFEFGANFFCIK